MATVTTSFVRSSRIDDDTGTPVGINVAVGAVALTAASLVAAAVPISRPLWRCAVIALVLGLFAFLAADRLAVVTIVLPTWLVMNGFLVNHLGELSWHGWADLERLLVLIGAGAVGLVGGALARRMQQRQERRRLGLMVQDLRTHFNEEKKQRA